MDREKRIECYQRFLAIATDKGVTPYRVAKDCAISKPIFTYWKHGQTMPSVNTLKKITQYLGVSFEDIVGEY